MGKHHPHFRLGSGAAWIHVAPCALLLMAAAADPTGVHIHEKDYMDYIPDSYLPTRNVAVDSPTRTSSVGSTSLTAPTRYLPQPYSGETSGQERGDVRLPFVAALLMGILLGSIIAHMFSGGGGGNYTAVQGPPWNPANNIPFRTWVREVQAWLNVTSPRLAPSQQAAALQLGLQGTARDVALSIPPPVIQHGAQIQGVPTDPVTYLIYTLANRFEVLEDERALDSGARLLDFRGRRGERIDSLLTRFDLARHEANMVGLDIPNFQMLSVILLRAVGLWSNWA